jgi:hypothetical protein
MLKAVHPHRRQQHLHGMDSGLRRNDTVDVEAIQRGQL